MSTGRSYLTDYAQRLRKNMTPEEIRLWTQFLHALPLRVRRQHPIGPYLVDFYVAAKRTVIELDGSQHYEDAGRAADAVRDAFFRQNGFHILRYPNLEVNQNFQLVCEDIWNRLGLARDSEADRASGKAAEGVHPCETSL
ncbi:MAG: endonuclease domain-containing protein [Oscillospiraceae bacterium]|nr:endonuclease domain-containing protein [Oscillospiraceae bacterium]